MDELCCIVILIILILIVVNCKSDTKQGFSCNDIDGRCYKFSSPQTSPILGELNNFNIRLLKHLREKYTTDTNTNAYAKHATELLLQNYNPDNLIENISNDKDDTSYVKDKGKVMALCLRERTQKKEIHEIEVLKFVNLHEMTHLAMERRDDTHLTDFWTCFKWLIGEAVQIGYRPVDFAKEPIVYCGLRVAYNPYFDENLQNV